MKLSLFRMACRDHHLVGSLMSFKCGWTFLALTCWHLAPLTVHTDSCAMKLHSAHDLVRSSLSTRSWQRFSDSLRSHWSAPMHYRHHYQMQQPRALNASLLWSAGCSLGSRWQHSADLNYKLGASLCSLVLKRWPPSCWLRRNCFSHESYWRHHRHSQWLLFWTRQASLFFTYAYDSTQVWTRVKVFVKITSQN